jgi:hypothetical protein
LSLFSFKTNFFFAKTRDGFEGVQRRGPVKGAVCPRSSQTVDSEHRWNNAGSKRRGLSVKKNEKKTTSTKNTEWETADCSRLQGKRRGLNDAIDSSAELMKFRG